MSPRVMLPPFLIDAVLKPTIQPSLLKRPCRVLDISTERDSVLVIDLPRKSQRHEGRLINYVRGPRRLRLSDLVGACEEGSITVIEKADTTDMPDEVLLRQAKNANARAAIAKDLKRRDDRLKVIAPIVKTPNLGTYRSPSQALADPELAQKIAKRAKECGIAAATVFSLIHRFWAGGSKLNALRSGYHRCGNLGRGKLQRNKLGRHSVPYAEKRVASPGYVLDKGMTPEAATGYSKSLTDRKKLACGYRLISHNFRPRDAYLITCGQFWAEHVVKRDGQIRSVLFPPEKRPTEGQFKYWGKKATGGQSVTELILGTHRWNEAVEARGGCVSDQVSCVGQLGVFDGTSTDTYLTSMMSRLRVLPPMTRLMIKDASREGLILGVYCGWEPPSPASALQCILHAASPKVEFCRRFGRTITEVMWPWMLERNLQADNGELKAAKNTEAETQFGFGLEYAPTRQGRKKGSIESQHRTDHKRLDERIPGNTHGKPHRRDGGPRPVELALFNYYEYMGELIDYILTYNNRDLVPHLAPIDMLRDCPGLAPTRLNIFNWRRERMMTAEIPCNVEEMRAFMLPELPAVIRKNGVYIVANFDGRDHILPRQRFTSPELVATRLMSEVRRTGHSIPTKVFADPEDLSRAWLPTRQGMIPLWTTIRDTTLVREGTLTDWTIAVRELGLASKARQGEIDQEDYEAVARRLAKTKNAQAERSEAIKDLPRPPSKSSLRQGLRKNVRDEVKLLNRQWDRENRDRAARASKKPHPQRRAMPANEAASAAMTMVNEQRRKGAPCASRGRRG